MYNYDVRFKNIFNFFLPTTDRPCPHISSTSPRPQISATVKNSTTAAVGIWVARYRQGRDSEEEAKTNGEEDVEDDEDGVSAILRCSATDSFIKITQGFISLTMLVMITLIFCLKRDEFCTFLLLKFIPSLLYMRMHAVHTYWQCMFYSDKFMFL